MLRQRRSRILAPKHLAWVRTLPSLIPGAGPVEAAHIRYGERAWWLELAIDPLLVAALLWVNGGNDEAGINIIRNAWLISLRRAA